MSPNRIAAVAAATIGALSIVYAIGYLVITASVQLGGVVVLPFSRHRRETSPKLAVLGYVAGTDLLLLFLASASGAAVPILVTGGLASLVLGPAWWFGVARRLVRSDGTGVSDRAPA